MTHVDSKDPYVRITLVCDKILTKGRFTRVCDYERRITSDDLNEYRKLLDAEQRERAIHRFLATRLHLVVNTESAHGCRWIKSNPSLGGERNPDFMIARRDSDGLRWSLYELQNVMTPLFLVNGQPSQELREGLHQISQWRGWLSRWGSHAAENHGYPGLANDFRAVVLIGRSADRQHDLAGDERIKDLQLEHRVEIRSYDSVFRAALWAVHGCGIDHVLKRQIPW
jgi:hypothetical protein